MIDGFQAVGKTYRERNLSTWGKSLVTGVFEPLETPKAAFLRQGSSDELTNVSRRCKDIPRKQHLDVRTTH